ncbi:hypothetical protein EJ06DRAFT_529674, partial [Trichodelitschia bisporula]
VQSISCYHRIRQLHHHEEPSSLAAFSRAVAPPSPPYSRRHCRLRQKLYSPADGAKDARAGRF